MTEAAASGAVKRPNDSVLEPPLRARSGGGRGRLVAATLAAADAAALVGAFMTTLVVLHSRLTFWLAVAGLGVVIVWWAVAQAAGLFSRDLAAPDHSTLDELVTIFNLLTAGAWLLFVAHLVVPATAGGKEIAVFWALAVPLVAVGRGCARASVRGRSGYVQRAIIVGAGEVGQLVARKLVQHPEYRIDVVGFVDDQPRDLRRELAHVPLIGSPPELAEIVRVHAADRVLFAFSNDSHADLLRAIRALAGTSVEIDIVPRLFEAFSPGVHVRTVEGLPLLGLTERRSSRPARVAKRLIDLSAAATILLLVAPVFGLIALAIKLDSDGSVFFRQRRLGHGMNEFTMLKFRTMTADTDETVHQSYIKSLMDTVTAPEKTNLYKLDQTDSVTRVGQWLRRLSLDELPQLINVFKGEMSLVGPRPCLAYEAELFESHHFARFSVPAGVTGLWQVTARARSTFKEALDLDVAYVRSWSLGLDLKLLIRTPLRVLKGSDTR